MTATAIQQVTTEEVKQAIMPVIPLQKMTTENAQQVTIEDVKQAILLLFKENSAELKAFLDDLSSKIVDTPTPKKKKTKVKKAKVTRASGGVNYCNER